MRRRKQLKNIAQGLLSSFTSRNNDVYGYWGIGKLYSLMLNKKHSIIVINLLEKSIIPKHEEFIHLIAEYRSRLMKQLLKNGFAMNNVSLAEIKLTQLGNSKKHSNKGLVLLKCVFEVTDDLNKTYLLENEVLCRKHNPKLEQKSNRNYE